MNKPKIFSFFSGAGFLDLGFEKSGFEIVFVNEIYAPFVKAYDYSRDKMSLAKPKYGYYQTDINQLLDNDEKSSFVEKVRECQKNSLVGFIGGPPCPDFSVGGKNKGEHGENGALTKSYVDVITTFQPDFFVFENVKGLWRTKKHREFYDRMKDILCKEYDLVDRLTNSIEYGAPQDRDRIFLFGIKKSFNADLSKFNWQKYFKFDRNDVLRKATWPAINGVTDFDSNLIGEKYKELTVSHWFNKNDVESHPNSKHHFVPKSPKFQIIKEGDASRKSYKRLHRDRYSPTAAYGNNEVHLHPTHNRRISAAEALAIQSLPREFELPPNMTLTDMFKTIGNGVPFLASKGLATTINEFLQTLERK
ncbi:DNA cytosine methyltransferase (plasmid) [Moraxella osloensis]|nr:DNA cytosine methyltransferase [Moraxella osloensis]QRO12250.1 DNA cytosine methyltransferase [Moraxella osloensis]